MTKRFRLFQYVLGAAVLLAAAALAYIRAGEPRSPVPPVVTPGLVDSAPPSDASMLFGGAMVAKPGARMETREVFEDYQLHLEWRSWAGAGHGAILLASGMAGYELDLTGLRQPGQWQSYDVIWTAPRLNPDGSPEAPAKLTAFLDGVLVRNGVTPPSQVAYRLSPIGLTAPDGPGPTDFRNIWVRRL